MSRYLNLSTLVVAAGLLSFGGIVGCSDALNGPVDGANPTGSTHLDKRTRANTRTKGPVVGTKTDTAAASNPAGAGAPTPPVGGCVHSMEYWATHMLEWPAPFTPDAQFCTVTGAPYSMFIQAPPAGDCWNPNWGWLLAQQYIAALLNKAYNNGNIPQAVQDAINEAQLFFHGRDMRVPLTPEEIGTMGRLYEIFNQFNYGVGGGVIGSLPRCPE